MDKCVRVELLLVLDQNILQGVVLLRVVELSYYKLVDVFKALV